MDIKYPIENEYMKCVLQINGFSGPHPRVWSNFHAGSCRVRGQDKVPSLGSSLDGRAKCHGMPQHTR